MDKFMFGVLIGVIACVIMATLGNKGVESKTPIQPEIRLTTDGKVVDTIYIYRTNK